jgi:hypothetical protein
MNTPDAIGWTATAVFTASYFASGHARLRRIQMGGASLWLAYGLFMQAPPVIGSNILVLGAACWAEYRDYRQRTRPSPRDRAVGRRRDHADEVVGAEAEAA